MSRHPALTDVTGTGGSNLPDTGRNEVCAERGPFIIGRDDPVQLVGHGDEFSQAGRRMVETQEVGVAVDQRGRLGAGYPYKEARQCPCHYSRRTRGKP